MSETKTKNPYRNIYSIPGGYYLNWQAAGQVYREAFMAATYGGMKAALDTALLLRDVLNAVREHIEHVVTVISAFEPDLQDARLRDFKPLTQKRVRRYFDIYERKSRGVK